LPSQTAYPLVGLIDRELAGGHVRLGRGLGERQAMDGGGAGEQVVVPGMGVLRQLLPVLGGGDDGLEGAAEVGDGAGEDLVGPVGQAGQAGQVGRAFGEGGAGRWPGTAPPPRTFPCATWPLG
jgi:hypothetical protein